MMIRATAVLWCFMVSTSAEVAAQTVRFEEVGGQRGIGTYVMSRGLGGGVAVADFDDDGDMDIFVPNAQDVPDQLYRNLGDGRFEEIASSLGLASTTGDRCALWFDYDDDHKLDLLVTNDADDSDTVYVLYRQRKDGRFEDVTRAAGLHTGEWESRPRGWRSGPCAGDINNDGYLDLYLPSFRGDPSLLLNRGDGTFTDITRASGLRPDPGEGLQQHQAVMVDFSGDGLLDIYVARDFAPNLLWLNQGDGTFVDGALEAGAGNAMNDMGLAVSDYDGDGDPDIYITNVFGLDGGHNVLLRNDSSSEGVRFTDVSRELGVDDGSWGWGACFLDVDNDGWLDIAATNGWDGAWADDTSRLFWNLGGDDGFTDVSAATGFDDTYWGSALVALDMDRDGDLDLLQTCKGGPLRLLENLPVAGDGKTPVRGGYLVVRPRLDGPNHRAIGAVVRARARGFEMTRWITAGTSYLGQEPAEAFFGLGDAGRVDSVTVEFPDGSRATLDDVSPNQVLVVMPPVFRRGDANTDGTVDISDALGILETLFSGNSQATCHDAADANDDTQVDISDAMFVLRVLFLVSTGLPAPGAETCGADVTADDLGCPSYPPCK